MTGEIAGKIIMQIVVIAGMIEEVAVETEEAAAVVVKEEAEVAEAVETEEAVAEEEEIKTSYRLSAAADYRSF